ncbi:MAG: ABC transporter permease [Rhodospirillaceae bacterium]|nr:ABC transporter permease [Rhodospirillaceae bacterium]
MVKTLQHLLLRWSMGVKLSALDRKLMRDVWRLKGQTLAICAVVAAGIALLVGTYGCLAALQLSKDMFYERTRFADVWASVKRAPNSMHDKLAQIPGIATVETRIVGSAILDLPTMTDPARGQLISVPEGDVPLLNKFDLLAGRLVTYGRPNEVMISEAFAKAHKLGLGDTVAATIYGKKRKLEIVGIALSSEYIYALAPGQLMPDDKRFGILWMGREALAAAYDLDEAFNSVTATLLHGAVEAEVLQHLDNLLKPYGGVGAYGRKDQISDFFLTNELAQLASSGAVAPPIFLGVAAFLLNIVISRLVATEREQIGLLKAFGYTDWDVGFQYTKLVAIIVGIGLALGLWGGVWFGQGMTNMYTTYFKFPVLEYRVNPGVFASAAIVTVIAGVIGGVSAVRQAIKLSPAVAMAPPVPTSFSRSRFSAWFEKLRISQPTRMIFRHVTRWPARTAMTVAGIAFSVALLIASFFFMDSVGKVIQVYFYQAERQTLTVSFVEPRGAEVEESILRLPGVLATQPVRSVAARLRHGPYTKRSGVNGLVKNADMNRLLGADEKPLDPPDGGIALSEHIAKELHVKVGDIITIEVLQERRPVVDVPVTQIVKQYLGFSTYMHIDEMNRMMKEGSTVTAVHVLADSRYIDDLYTKLKNTPMVAGVALTEASLKGFQDTMDQTMYVMIGFYIAFSSLIAFGVAYNSARIALSERARSLASLRVLGFTREEVAYILLGEVGVQTLLALPVGCAFGYLLALAMSPMLKTDMYDFPFIINDPTYGLSVLVVTIAAVICAALVRRRVYQLDLISVLKTRE